MVVRTQNIRCKRIPNKKSITNKVINLYFVKMERIYASNIVNTTSIMAISNILKECAPVFGFPNIFLYLHKLIL